MPKKNSSKVSFATKEDSNTKQKTLPKKTNEVDLKRKKPEQEKPKESNDQPKKVKQKKSDEIDEIFAALKKRKTEKAMADKSEEIKDKIKKKKKSKMPEKWEDLNSDSGPRRRTNDGLAIYSAEELGISKKDAGETPLCPFDCHCCF